MRTNDILIELSNALDIETSKMVEIFKLGGVEIPVEKVESMLLTGEDMIKCEYAELEMFLNGFIILKRGKQESKPGKPEKPPLTIKDGKHINNILLKKLKIALSLSGEDMLDIFDQVDVILTKDKLTTYFRKEGHKHYKRCSDEYTRAFLNGLAELGIM